MDVQMTNLQQLHDAIMSIWTKISDECVIHTKYVHNCVIFALFSLNYLYCFKFIDRIIF